MKSDGSILVFNAGSSTLKFQVYTAATAEPESLLRGTVRDLGDAAICEWVHRGRRERTVFSANDHAAAARHVMALLKRITIDDRALLASVTVTGHRIVHGGARFFQPTLLTTEVLEELDALNPLAPLHNPPALGVIRTCRQELPEVPMVAVFDTAYFHALPNYVRCYALPARWMAGPRPIRRYGFHGLAHRYMAERYAITHAAEATSSRLITLQLGHGCSVAAIRNGNPVETSMGFTPLEGLIMATRPGDVDVGVVPYLLEQEGITAEALNDGLNHRAGLLGLSGASADMHELLELESQGHAGAHLAIEAFCHRARKYLGAYLAVLGGADAIVFGGGIGEHAPAIRKRICTGMQWCGLSLDTHRNREARGDEARISTADAPLAAHVIPVDEEVLIVGDTLNCLRAAG